MYNFSIDTILVARDKNPHEFIFHEYSMIASIPKIDDWIRFIHIEKEDFKEKFLSRVLFVRPTHHDKDKIQKIIDRVGIRSPIIFDATNKIIQEITKNFSEKY